MVSAANSCPDPIENPKRGHLAAFGGNGSHMRAGQVDEQIDDALRDEAMSRLQALGIDTALFVWPAADNFENFRPRKRPVAAA